MRPRAEPRDAADVDPELVSLRRRIPAGPLLVASVLGFAALLMVRMRADLVFSRQGEKPNDLGQIRDQRGTLPDNGYVSFSGDVDARAPVRLRGIQDVGYRLAPIRGTGGRIWIHENGEAANVVPTYDGRFTGRLRRLDDVAFGDGLRDLVAALPPQPRVVFPAGLAGGRFPAVYAEGDPLAPPPDSPVVALERVRDAAVVTLVKTDSVGDEAAARQALTRAGLDGVLGEKTATSWTFDVAADPATARDRLRAARLFGAAAEPRERAHTGRFADLQVAGDSLTLAGQRVPVAALDHIVISVPARVPPDAWVLLTGDTPSRLWYMAPLYGVLALIAVLMGWALVIVARSLRKQSANPSV